MNKTFGITLAVVVVLGGGIAFYASNSVSKNQVAATEQETPAQEAAEKAAMASDEMVKEDTTAQKNDDAMTEDVSGAKMEAGSYEAYDAQKIAMASPNHDVVLFFRASWCPTCRNVDADIRAHIKDIPATVTILDVNYDDSTDLKKKYGVTYQHTFVQVDAKGNLIKKWSGSATLAAIVSEAK